MRKERVALILGIVCLMLTYAICVQINTIKSASENLEGSVNDNAELKDEYLKWQSNYKTMYSSLEKAEKELENNRQSATENNDEDEQRTQDIALDNNYLGLTEVTGPGLTITLDDNRDISTDEVLNVSDYLVHEGDLLQVVNELFNAGADAISINDQRVTYNTSIMCDGNIIRVNGELVGVPITIKAIGYPERLEYALKRPDGYLDIMENAGVVVKTKKEDNIKISKYEGVYSHEYITRGDA